MASKWPLVAAVALTCVVSGCDPLPGRLRTDPPGTAFNTHSSRWYGSSSTGAYSTVRQVTTGLHQFSFKETWFRGKGSQPLVTLGKGSYTPATGINIYEYSQPPGVVVVRTAEGHEALSTEDEVLASTLPQFKPGERITYTLRP
ncbi:MAG: hypothetical protein RLZZ631_669 [Cyanobacteriota bacterium]